MAAVTSVNGLITGLDTSSIIDGIINVQKSRVTRLQTTADTSAKKQTAFKAIEARLLAFQQKLANLGRAQNNVVDGKTINSSNKDLVTAAAGASASAGVYSVRVNSLARAEQVASQGFDNPASEITQGTFTLKVGTGASTSVTIDSTNNTVQGLVNAINSANAGVSASLINDGSDSRTQPYRLLLTATQPGAANNISITNSLAASSGSAVKPNFASSTINDVVKSTSFSGSSNPTINAGAGTFTGTSNNTYRFTVATGGTVGTDNGIQINYTDSTGTRTGSLTYNSGDVEAFQAVDQGLQLKLSAGTLVAGQTFTVDAFVSNVQSASDASVSIGSGPGAVSVQSGTNIVDNVIAGVTLNLASADPTKDVAITVSNDTTKAKQAVLEVVEAYNEVMKFIDSQAKYDAEKKIAGLLQGERSAAQLQDQLRSAIGQAVPGLPTQANRLGAIGVTTTREGLLEVNDAKLDDVLSGRVTGVTLKEVKALFGLTGVSTNPGVSFVSGSTRTKTATTAYQVNLSQAAKQAKVQAGSALAASTTITTANNAFILKVNGQTSSTLTIADGTYTQLDLAREIEAKVNADTALFGHKIAANVEGGKLNLSTLAYGSASEVTLVSGSALTSFGFTGAETAKGIDVIGKYIVGGNEELATGSGQFLIGNSTNANTADLQVRVTLTDTQVVPGVEASLTVTRGIASRLDQVVAGMLDPVNGRLKSINDGFQQNIDATKKAITIQEAALESKRTALTRQFVALETAVAKLRTQGDVLTNSFAARK